MNRLNIAKLRKSLKMNQETFRKEVGISQSYLSELETGKKNLTTFHLIKRQTKTKIISA